MTGPSTGAAVRARAVAEVRAEQLVEQLLQLRGDAALVEDLVQHLFEAGELVEAGNDVAEPRKASTSATPARFLMISCL